MVADCVCTGGSARLPSFDVQVLVLGDCDELVLDDPTGKLSNCGSRKLGALSNCRSFSPSCTRFFSAPSPTVLYLYRIGKNDFYHAPKSLRAVNIYHSNVILR